MTPHEDTMQDILLRQRIDNRIWHYLNGDMVDSGGGTARRARPSRAGAHAGGDSASVEGRASGLDDRAGADAGAGGAGGAGVVHKISKRSLNILAADDYEEYGDDE